MPMPAIRSRLPHVGTTIFTTMSRLAQEHGAINMGQGFPSYGPPAHFVTYMQEALAGATHQYAPMEGLMALREAIAQKIQVCYGAQIDPATEITVTSGGTEALFNAITAVVGEVGDEIVCLQPCYDSYVPAIVLNGGHPVLVNLNPETFRPDWQRVHDAITSRTKAIIINSPHNPSGAVWKAEDITALQELAERHGLWIIADEVYEHMVFDGGIHHSMLRYPALYAQSIVVHSFGKTYHATGWKMGYTVAPAAMTVELRKVHQFNTFSSYTPIQHALVKILAHEDHYQSLPAFYEAKRDALLRSFSALPLEPVPCQGTYFQLFRYGHLSQENDLAFAQRLTREAKVTAIPVSSFYAGADDHKLLRFCFAKDEALMQQAADQLAAYFQEQLA